MFKTDQNALLHLDLEDELFHLALNGNVGALDKLREHDPVCWEHALMDLAADGNVEALEALREELKPIDYDELGWGD